MSSGAHRAESYLLHIPRLFRALGTSSFEAGAAQCTNYRIGRHARAPLQERSEGRGLRPVGGNRALHAPYLSFATPVGIGSVAGQPRSFCAASCYRPNLFANARNIAAIEGCPFGQRPPRPMSSEFDPPKEGRFFGFSLCDCWCKMVKYVSLGVTGLRNSHARIKRRTEAIWEREREGGPTCGPF